MASTEEVLKALQNAKITTLAATEPEELVIDAESRTITVPSSERLFGVTGDMNIERKYFRCPKIVGDNVDLSTHQIFIAYVYTETESGSIFPSIGVAPYHCEDVEVDGEDITFSWKLTGNVFKNPGFILFKMYAKKTETDPNTVFNTTPAIGTVLATIPDGTEEIVEEHPDVIAQIFDRLDALESGGGGGTGGTTNYNNLSNKPQLNGVTLEGNKTLDQVGVLAKNQGASNSGKYLSVGSDGNVVPADAPSGGTVDPEQIKQAVNGYLEENPPSGMTAEQEQQLNQNTTDVADLKSALEQKGLPSGGTTGQVLAKKTDSDYDAEWKDVPTGTSDQYFEMVNSGTTTTNGVSLDITDVVNSGVPSYGKWDALYNWYHSSYDKNSETNYAYKNGLGINSIISKPIKGKPYLREFCRVGGQFYTSNNITFYGCDSDKALEEDGHSCKQCTKNFEFTQIDNLPDGTEGSGVLVLYPNEEYDYYYCIITNDFYNSDSDNARNATWIGAFDASILDNPLIEISSSTGQHLKMKDEYFDGYYKNMFSYDKFKEIFRTYFAQMSPKVGIPQTYGKAIYIGGDSLHAYAGGDGFSTSGFVTNWNKYLGFARVTNAGYAGSKWSETTGGGGIKKAKDLISAGTVYDVIILAWGTNDDNAGNGTIDDVASDTEGATMVAAMKWIITNLRNTFKSTAIGVIIPPPKHEEDGMEVRGDLMVQVCELLHVPYVDMREYISISDLGSDTIHLGTGAGKYGAAEASLILRICPYGDTLYPGATD